MHSVIINLDLPIEKRYENVVKLFDVKKLSQCFNNIYESFLPKIPMVNNMISLSIKANKKKIMYKDEVKYWSNILDLPFHKIMIVQLLLELYSGCTTAVHQNKMYRVVDSDFDFLKEFTYQVKFINNSGYLYDAICWLGNIGVFTAKNTEYSIAINQRKIQCKSSFEYVKSLFTKYSNAISTYWPVSYIVRHIFENKLSKFETFNMLNGQASICPTFFILNYFDSSQSPVIFERQMKNSLRITHEYVIQCNSDNSLTSENIHFSKERTEYVKNLILEGKSLDKMFNESPTLNSRSIYSCVLSKDIILANIL